MTLSHHALRVSNGAVVKVYCHHACWETLNFRDVLRLAAKEGDLTKLKRTGVALETVKDNHQVGIKETSDPRPVL